MSRETISDEKADQDVNHVQSNLVAALPEDRFDRITRLSRKLLQVESTAIALVSHEHRWFKSRAGFDLADGAPNDTFGSFMSHDSGILEVSDARLDPRFADNPLVTGAPHIRFFAAYPLFSPSGEELGAFYAFDPKPKTLSPEERDLLEDFGLWAQWELVIESEMARAVEVQRGLLPKQRIIKDGFETAGGCVSARAIGGDFYDWYNVNEGEAFTLVDVMGKGIGAAIIAATVRSVLRAGSQSIDMINAVEVAEETLESDLNSLGSFATLFYARLNTSTGETRFIDAGHGLSLLLRLDGTTTRLTSNNPPLGMGIDTIWAEQSFTMLPGDTLVSVSDGVIDLFGGTLLGLNQVERYVREAKDSDGVVKSILALAGNTAKDDVTILVVHRNELTAV